MLLALFWGYRAPAERLAREGVVPRNLRTIAGLSRINLLESFFDDAGALRPEAGADWAAHSEAAAIEQYLKEAAT